MIRNILALLFVSSVVTAADKPNILWLTYEDSSPHLGCYGDVNANTPTMDALAARGMRYHRAWSNAPVCAAARTSLISGRWAPSDGAEHMRSEVPMPNGHKMYPQFLREAGYYCTNNSKEDYNLTKPEGVWDESSGQAHWKNRKAGQPFFAIFNDTGTHESQIRNRPHVLIHDPAKVVVPPYMPDTPEVRCDWAQHFDNVTSVDGNVGKLLKELDAAGLSEDTIIFSYADHGTGMPRSKRWPYDSGLRVPFIVYFPKKWEYLAPKDYKAGGVSQRLISFIDLAPTLLSLAGVKAPDYFHGRAFAGVHAQDDSGYAFGFRGRMDERYDCVRSVTNGRYIYIRQFMPHLPYGQHVNYMFEQATTRVWYDLHKQGQLNSVQDAFWKEKPAEELYDLEQDPYEIQNLAQSLAPEHVKARQELSEELSGWMVKTRDLGMVPEAERLAVSNGKSPADVYTDTDKNSEVVKEVLGAAEASSDWAVAKASALVPLLGSAHADVRYWGAVGVLARGSEGFAAAHSAIVPLLTDKSPNVRVAAAEVLATHGTAEEQAKAWDVLLTSAVPTNGSPPEAAEALNAIDRLGDKAKPYKDRIAALNLAAPESSPARIREYPTRLVQYMSTTLGYEAPKSPVNPGKAKAKAKGKGKGKKAKAAQ